MRRAITIISFVYLLGTLAAGPARAAPPCGDLENGVGPYDYWTGPRDKIELVERFHFTESVATLRKGASSVRIGADINYTLRAVPNHPHALNAMAELAKRQKTEQPEGSTYTVRCWFDRAMRFSPNDGNVRLIYGITLLRTGQRDAGIEHLRKADEMLPRNPNVHYNLGLAYYDAKDYDNALKHARLAYEFGAQPPGLRDMLKRVGKWS